MTDGNAGGPLTYLGPTAPATEAKHFAGASAYLCLCVCVVGCASAYIFVYVGCGCRNTSPFTRALLSYYPIPLPAYGFSGKDAYRTDVSDATLFNVYLRPWKDYAVKAGGRGIMMS